MRMPQRPIGLSLQPPAACPGADWPRLTPGFDAARRKVRLRQTAATTPALQPQGIASMVDSCDARYHAGAPRGLTTSANAVGYEGPKGPGGPGPHASMCTDLAQCRR
jgi:hypothetical protein